MWGKGYDGIGFSVAQNACFIPELPDDLPVYLGAERERLTAASLDMTTGQECAPARLEQFLRRAGDPAGEGAGNIPLAGLR